jgi:hypothetical protein
MIPFTVSGSGKAVELELGAAGTKPRSVRSNSAVGAVGTIANSTIGAVGTIANKLKFKMKFKDPHQLVARKPNDRTPYAFITTIFHITGTFFDEIWRVLLVVNVFATISVVAMDSFEIIASEMVYNLHSKVGTLIGFLVAFRVTQAYNHYVEGRRCLGGILNCLRIIAAAANSFLPHGRADPMVVTSSQVEIERWLNIMLVFVRQHLRESHHGFDMNLDSDSEQVRDLGRSLP